MARLKEVYNKEIVPALTKQFGYKSVMEVPRIQKIVLNMGVGEAIGDKKLLEVAKSVGYDSDAAFSKAFKRIVGVAPRAYRRSASEPHSV